MDSRLTTGCRGNASQEAKGGQAWLIALFGERVEGSHMQLCKPDPLHPPCTLVHLGRWQSEAPARAPPVAPDAWPAHASLALTYHPVPDIV